MVEGVRGVFEEMQARRDERDLLEKQTGQAESLIREAALRTLRYWNESDDPKRYKVRMVVERDVEERTAALRISGLGEGARSLVVQYEPGEGNREASFYIRSKNDSDIDPPISGLDNTADEAMALIQQYVNQELLKKVLMKESVADFLRKTREPLKRDLKGAAMTVVWGTALVGGLEMLIDKALEPEQNHTIEEQPQQKVQPAPGESAVARIAGTDYVAVMPALDI